MKNFSEEKLLEAIEVAPKIYKDEANWHLDDNVYSRGTFLISKDRFAHDLGGIKIADGILKWIELPYVKMPIGADDIIKNYKGAISYEGYVEVYKAYNTLKNMWMPPMGGFIENGIDYKYIDIIDTKKNCLAALDTIRKFIEEFAADVDEEDL